MFKRYGEILSIPGALKFSIAGLLARFPMSLVGISTILMVRALYGEYTVAGIVSAASVIAYAVLAPWLSRLVDQHGQAKVMVPSLIISAASLIAVIFCAINLAPYWVLIILNAIAGGSSGSMGALVRARWAYVTENPSQIQAAYSLEAALDEFAFVVGPVAATTVATMIHPTAGLWLATFLVLFGGLWFLSQRATEPPPRAPLKDGEVKERQPSVMLNPAMIVLAITYLGAGSLFGANDLAVVAFAEMRGAPQFAGILLAIFSFGSLVGALVYGAHTWKWPLWKLYGVGVLALAIGASTFVLAHTMLILAAIMVVTGVVVAPTMTNVNTIIQQIMPKARLTESLAWMSAAMCIGISVGTGVTGSVIDNSGAKAGFLVVVASGWIMALAMGLGLKKLKAETERTLTSSNRGDDLVS